MESCQSRMQKALASYPDIAKAFEEVIFAFKENSAENKAYSMHNCVQSIAEYLYSKCNAPDCDNLQKKINMLYKAKVISAQTYVNYMSIICQLLTSKINMNIQQPSKKQKQSNCC